MMSTYATGMFIGGLVISFLGSVGEYMREKSLPKPKAVARDFIIGAVLVVFLMQILPESMTSLLSYVPTLDNLTSKLPSLSSLTLPSGSIGDGPELQVGPVRF